MTNKDCKKVHQIWLAEGEGRQLTLLEEATVENHMDHCPSCLVERRVVQSIQSAHITDPPPTLDELTRRRQMDQALHQVAALERSTFSGADRVLAPNRNRLLIGFGMGFAAAAVALVLGVVLVDSRTDNPTSQDPATATPLSGDIMLATGEVRVSGVGGDASALGRHSTIEIDDGTAVAQLETGIKLRLAKRSNLFFKAVNRRQLDLNLRQGELFVHVDPSRDGPPLVVSTPHGRVRVLGTVFSVDVDSENTVVRVYRSSVEVVDALGNTQTIRQGQSFVVGQGTIEQIDEKNIAAAEGQLRMLDLVVAPDAVELAVSSLPLGATLRVDGIELGETPLTSMVRPGTREVVITRPGHESVRELMHLVPGTKVSRMFELSESGLPVVRPAPRSPAMVDRPRARTPEDLVGLARSHRQTGRWKEALRAYQHLIERFPNSALGRAALVSMGQIQLERLGRPESALRSFDQYLRIAGHGTLAQEAAFGRTQALRALGRHTAERSSLRAFLRDFPDAIQVPRVQERLDQLK